MMQANTAMPYRRANHLRHALTQIIAVFGIGIAMSFSPASAYGFTENLWPQPVSNSAFEKLVSGHFGEKAVSAMPSEKEFRWAASIEKVCTIGLDEQVAQRLAGDESLRNVLAAHIGRIYRIGGEDARTIVEAAVKVSNAHDVDPFIVLGIASVESSMNPEAQSSYGAAGLMQVYAPSHREMLEALGVDTTDNVVAAQTLKRELETNLIAGTLIYRQYLKQYKTVPMALQAYNGAKKDATKKYARKVLKMRDQYQQAMFAHVQIALAHTAIADAHFSTGLSAGATYGSPDNPVVAAISGVADDSPVRGAL